MAKLGNSVYCLGVGINSSQVFGYLRSFKDWIQTEACVIPRDVNIYTFFFWTFTVPVNSLFKKSLEYMKLLKSKIKERVQMLVFLSEWFRIQKGVRWSGCVTVRRWCISMGWRRWKWTLPRTCYRCIVVAQLSDTQVRHTLNLIWSANTISFEVWWSEWSPLALD